MASVDIAVPTYNCARWLDEFMESILAQDFTDWRIVTRDDGSTDDTVARMAAWKARLGGRLEIIPNETKDNLGPVGCYNIILSSVDAPWVFLADPDDVWKPHKIRKSLLSINGTQIDSGVTTPVLAFTDAEVINENGEFICSSYWKWQRLRPNNVCSFSRTIMESPAISSGMIMNRALLCKALPIEGSYSFQDWWLVLVAVAFGKVIPVYEKTFLYRRHGGNDSNVPITSSFLTIMRGLRSSRARLKKLLFDISRQSEVFLLRFRSNLDGVSIGILKDSMVLSRSGYGQRCCLILKRQLLFGSILKNIGALLLP